MRPKLISLTRRVCFGESPLTDGRHSIGVSPKGKDTHLWHA